MIKAGIIGATGYAGGELVRLLLGHKNAEIKWYGSRSYIDKKYYEVYQNMFELVEDTCLDDKIYDPITFALNDTGLREGWKVAFQHIPAGSHFKLYIHPDLGYGNADYGDIPASSVLIFEIKFHKISVVYWI